MFKTSQKRPKESSNGGCDVVKSGYAKIKSKKFKVWQKKWLVFHRASSLGPCRLEKYSDEKSALKEYHGKPIHLKNLEMIEKIPYRGGVHGLRLILRDGGERQIAFRDESEADNWMNVIMKECLGSIYSGKPDLLASGVQKDLQEIFPVYLQASQETNIEGECYLQVTPEHIYIWDAEEPKLKLLAWPLAALRRYGYDKTKFTLESGRHCTSGEGLFTFRTSEGEGIYQKVHGATLSIAKSHQRLATHVASRYSVNKFCVPNR